jgi:histidine phosphotransferase ChpT
MKVQARGANPKLASGVADLVAGRPESGAVDAHSIQPYFTGMVARECGLEVAITVEAESVTLEARPTGVKA